MAGPAGDTAAEVRCSFCGRVVRQPPRTPAQVVLGPDGVAICKACVSLCVEIFSEPEPG